MVILKNVWWAVIASGLLVLSAACSNDADSAGGAVLAKVGEVEITKAEFEAELNQLPSYVKGRVATAEGRREFLDNMLTRRALLLEAERMGLHDDPRLVRQIADYRERLILQQLMADKLPQQTELTDDELREHYEKNIEEYQVDEQVRIRQILIRMDSRDAAEARKMAEGLQKRLEQGEAFEDLAREYSEDTSAQRGGDRGFLSRERMPENVAEAAFAMTERGQVSEWVETEAGVHIVQLLERKGGGKKDFEEVREQIRRRLAPQKERRTYEAFVAGLRDQHDIRINEQALAAVGAPAAAEEEEDARANAGPGD